MEDGITSVIHTEILQKFVCIVTFESRVLITMKQVGTICRNFNSQGCVNDPGKHQIFHQKEVPVEEKERQNTMICAGMEKDRISLLPK